MSIQQARALKRVRSGVFCSTIVGKRELVFNTQKRRVLRKRISNSEVTFGILFIILLAVIGGWFAAQKNRFDPSERDIAFSLLEQQSVEDKLYRTPLKRWADPEQAVGTGSQPDLSPFSPAVLDGGWTSTGRIQQFDPSNLYEKINGAATQFFQFGFRELSYLVLAHPQSNAEISIDLYDMEQFQNALGIFAAQRSKGRDVHKSDSALYYPTELGAIGIVNNLYFKLVGNETSEFIRQKALTLIDTFTDLAAASSAMPEPFRILSSGLDIDFENIAYVKNDVFQYGFAKDFWFGKPNNDSNLRYFVHQAESEEAAATLYERIAKENQQEYALIEENESSALFEHNFLHTYYYLAYDGDLVYGIEGAPDKGRTHTALASLQEVLTDAEE